MRSDSRKQFENIYQRNIRRIYGLAWKLSGFQAGEAEDLCQETFYRAFRSFHTYTDENHESAWLTRICINTSREMWRRRAFYSEQVEPQIVSGNADGTARSVENGMSDLELSGKLREILKTMDPEFREVVVLRHMEGYDTREVSERMDIPEGTVRSRLKRAREIIMDRLRAGRGGSHEL
ncbi:RNA polymerase sigma factor [bacterium]|nr:RNA polymerase sigma factor [candidate division CSSED10-310 bacterium]